jgi:hypothetical protein
MFIRLLKDFDTYRAVQYLTQVIQPVIENISGVSKLFKKEHVTLT